VDNFIVVLKKFFNTNREADEAHCR
jgi:hypothetical protein